MNEQYMTASTRGDGFDFISARQKPSLAAWGRRGNEETGRQNLAEIRKQLEQEGGKAPLSELEFEVLKDIAAQQMTGFC